MTCFKFELHCKSNVKVVKDFKQVNVIVIFSCVHCREWIRGEILKKERPFKKRWQPFGKEKAFAWTWIIPVGIKSSSQKTIWQYNLNDLVIY